VARIAIDLANPGCRRGFSLSNMRLLCRRLAVEGLEEHVASIAVGLAKVLANMTRAMAAGTQAGKQADAEVRQ
jgi:hypothetical protein